MENSNDLIDEQFSEEAVDLQTDWAVKLGRAVAIVSASIGTLILLGYLVSKEENIAVAGFFFLYLAAIVNAIVLIIVFIAAIADALRRRRRFLTCGFMLLNLPYAALIAWLGIWLMDNY